MSAMTRDLAEVPLLSPVVDLALCGDAQTTKAAVSVNGRRRKNSKQPPDGEAMLAIENSKVPEKKEKKEKKARNDKKRKPPGEAKAKAKSKRGRSMRVKIPDDDSDEGGYDDEDDEKTLGEKAHVTEG